MTFPPLSVGVDLVPVRDVARSIERFGDRYLTRLFTDGEIRYCAASAAEAPRRFAARFAAKEAAMKALRLDGRGLDWRTIEVHRAEGGWCELRLHGAADALARERGVGALAVSLSHDGEYATAVVTALARAAAAGPG